jgi:hypothetical protein
MSTSSSTLSLEARVIVRGNGRANRVPCPFADPSPYDCYDQAPGRYVCVDQTGRKRRRHDYTITTRQGTRCLFCWRLRSWEPI